MVCFCFFPFFFFVGGRNKKLCGTTNFIKTLLLALLMVATIVGPVHSDMLPTEEPFYVEQPDGQMSLPIYLVGTAAYHREESQDGYTIIDDPDGSGWKVYAVKNELGELVSSGLRFGFGNPSKMGILKHLEPSEDVKRAKGGRFYEDKMKENSGVHFPHDGGTTTRGGGGGGEEDENSGLGRRKLAQTTGVVKNLVVLMKFSDHVGRPYPSLLEYDTLFNNDGPNPTICPTGSIKDVFHVSSYDQLTINSTIADWVTLPNTESYYANGNSGLISTFHDAIRDALDMVDPYVDFSEYDQDNDGYIDFITFLHSGYGAEWGGVDCYGADTNNRIWSHKWSLYTQEWISSEGVKVYTYHVSPAVWGRGTQCEHNIGRIGVIAHESGHFLGLPDLYDGSNGQGIGSYCLMANSWGFDGSQHYPPIMSPWCRIWLGWMTPTIINGPDTYTIEQSCNVSQVFKITDGFPNNEYLLIENRQKCGTFDEKVPQPGLTIWHIDEQASFTTEGYPGQTGWPGNGNHYRVALLQADGNYNMEKNQNRGDSGDVWHPNSVYNELLPSTDTLTGPFPNSDAYQGGNVYQTGHAIKDISQPSGSMTFTYGNSITQQTPSAIPSFSKAPTIYPSKVPSSQPTTSPVPSAYPSVTPTNSPTEVPTMIPTIPLAGVGQPCLVDSDCKAGLTCSNGNPNNRVCEGNGPPTTPAPTVISQPTLTQQPTPACLVRNTPCSTTVSCCGFCKSNGKCWD